MKLSQIISSQDGLNKLLTVKLPIKVAFKISKLINKIKPDLEIYNEQRIKLVKDLGEVVNKETDAWSVKTENLEKFNTELAKLQDIELDLDYGPGKPLEKINIDELGDIEIETNDLINLDWLFE